MEIFKRGRGRPKKDELDVTNVNVIPNVPSLNNNIFDGVSENTDIDDSIDSDESEIQKKESDTLPVKPYQQVVDELEATKVEYQKILALYMNAKKNEPTKNVVNNDNLQKLETSARNLYKRFSDIATGNNKYKTKYDSVRIQGVNGVLDEIRKHFPTINFNK